MQARIVVRSAAAGHKDVPYAPVQAAGLLAGGLTTAGQRRSGTRASCPAAPMHAPCIGRMHAARTRPCVDRQTPVQKQEHAHMPCV
jgi:hypothetical protein